MPKVACVNPFAALLADALAKPIDEKNPILRSALVHVIVPDHEQLAAMNQMAILAVQVHVREKGELPVQEVSLKQEAEAGKSQLGHLPRIFPGRMIDEAPENSEVARKLGHYTEMGYYFVPVAHLRKKGMLWVSFHEQKQYLSIMELPLASAAGWPEKFDQLPDPSRAPDPETTVGLIKKTFCFTP